jgi:hypothetical protein
MKTIDIMNLKSILNETQRRHPITSGFLASLIRVKLQFFQKMGELWNASTFSFLSFFVNKLQ